jgi:hypothetical protein
MYYSTGNLTHFLLQVNETKSIQTTFTFRKGRWPPAQINHTNIQQKDQARYLGLTFDSKLNWRHHIVKKRKQMNQKSKEVYWLIEKKIPPLHRQQVANIQNSHQVDMDLRHPALGLRQQI